MVGVRLRRVAFNTMIGLPTWGAKATGLRTVGEERMAISRLSVLRKGRGMLTRMERNRSTATATLTTANLHQGWK